MGRHLYRWGKVKSGKLSRTYEMTDLVFVRMLHLYTQGIYPISNIYFYFVKHFKNYIVLLLVKHYLLIDTAICHETNKMLLQIIMLNISTHLR